VKYVKYILLIFVFACQNGYAQLSATDYTEDSYYCYQNGYYSQVFGFQVPDKFNSLLYDTLETWLGTPYRSAGMSLKGVDCSGFVTCMYNGVYGVKFKGRRCSEIYNEVAKIDKFELKEGDIVFFKIRHSEVSHVGLYLGNDKFIHSSTSSGVIISDLKEEYYQKHFWGGGRLAEFQSNTEYQE
jgi:lipoprotein Spr